jgi:ABC-type multidrug transport system fused ATPase/permease subunit
MNDASDVPTSNPDPKPPAYHDWREERSASRWARREARRQRRASRHYGWIGGAILILLGVIFLLQNAGFLYLVNWWALFILIPAFWAYVAAWDLYQGSGRVTRGAAGSLTVGVLLTILSLIFLMNLATNIFWPVLLIAGGIALFITAFLPA